MLIEFILISGQYQFECDLMDLHISEKIWIL